MCQQVVLLVNLVCQFSDIFQLGIEISTLPVVGQVVDGIQNAVDEGQNAHDLRHLGTLLHVAPLGLLDTQTADAQLIGLQLQEVVELMVLLATLVEMVEQPQQEQQQHDGSNDGPYHPVQLFGRGVENAGSGSRS